MPGNNTNYNNSGQSGCVVLVVVASGFILSQFPVFESQVWMLLLFQFHGALVFFKKMALDQQLRHLSILLSCFLLKHQLCDAFKVKNSSQKFTSSFLRGCDFRTYFFCTFAQAFAALHLGNPLHEHQMCSIFGLYHSQTKQQR